ncbi:MAG TPA: GAP family protein [Thermomicrobiales bacterium]|nr:GAP family protein [Thermomicrobiales bacterium]
MVSAIVGMLPLGLGIALNPIAIVVSILIVRRPDPRRNAIAFVAAWVLGLALLVVVSAWILPNLAGVRRDPPPALYSWVWAGVGIVLLLGAARARRDRLEPGKPTEARRWTGILSQGGIIHVFAIGLFLSMVSLRNLALLAAAAAQVGQAGLALLETAITIAVFVAASALGVALPLVVRLVGGPRADALLERWSDWLNLHLGTMTAVVLAALGLYLLGRGIGTLVPGAL